MDIETLCKLFEKHEKSEENRLETYTSNFGNIGHRLDNFYTRMEMLVTLDESRMQFDELKKHSDEKADRHKFQATERYNYLVDIIELQLKNDEKKINENSEGIKEIGGRKMKWFVANVAAIILMISGMFAFGWGISNKAGIVCADVKNNKVNISQLAEASQEQAKAIHGLAMEIGDKQEKILMLLVNMSGGTHE